MKRIFIWPDAHVPFEDKRCFNLALKVCKSFKPDIQVILGDFWDFYSVSFHSKERRGPKLADELEAGKVRLEEITKLGGKRKVFVCGNHEYRLDRYIADRAPELAGWGLSPKDIVMELGWEFIPYKDFAKIGKLHVTHDVGHAGKTALVASQAAYEGNLVIGHTHRMGTFYTGSVRGDHHVAMSPGWLGSEKKVGYMYKAKLREWQHGFGYGYLEDNGTVHLRCAPIVKNKCVVEGKLYKG